MSDVDFIPAADRKHHDIVALPRKCPECRHVMVPRLNSGRGIFVVRFPTVTASFQCRLLKPKPCGAYRKQSTNGTDPPTSTAPAFLDGKG
jgi:ssDNA-binding Zn-finger/Zn-ribbon topoisomerase 1